MPLQMEKIYAYFLCDKHRLMDLQPDDIHWNISDPGWAKSSYANFFAPWIAGSAVYIHQV